MAEPVYSCFLVVADSSKLLTCMSLWSDGGRRQHTGAVLFNLARPHVVHVAGGKNIVGLLPGLIGAGVVVDRHFPFADHLKTVSRDHNRRAFREANAEQFGVLPDDWNHVIPAIPCV